eukprot:CAMPEP_0183826252 /NCGR_PEP_ID=MMETSP0807_2-20130328/1600_1 /TAXON_ID=88271 /ORGANISM="Picocystis salinarum, Strain CCMP1897" /LENGTH=166 /DNA_ID=CAMNT_0026071351 /DNA_START=94 /DNA_END=590 /DNA_ORIENTATION=-
MELANGGARVEWWRTRAHQGFAKECPQMQTPHSTRGRPCKTKAVEVGAGMHTSITCRFRTGTVHACTTWCSNGTGRRMDREPGACMHLCSKAQILDRCMHALVQQGADSGQVHASTPGGSMELKEERSRIQVQACTFPAGAGCGEVQACTSGDGSAGQGAWIENPA